MKRAQTTKRKRTPTQAARLTAAPHGPLDAETITYIGRLAVAMEALGRAQQDWTLANEALLSDPEALGDAARRQRAQTAMDDIVAAAVQLTVGPVPDTVAAMEPLMQKVADHARAMAVDYVIALGARDSKTLKSLKSHSTKMFGYIRQAQKLIPR